MKSKVKKESGGIKQKITEKRVRERK